MGRSSRTLGNYLGYVRTGCILCKAPTEVHGSACVRLGVGEYVAFTPRQVFADPAIERAKVAIEKAKRFTQREPLWIRRCALFAQVDKASFVCSQDLVREDGQMERGGVQGRAGIRQAVHPGVRFPPQTPIGSPPGGGRAQGHEV